MGRPSLRNQRRDEIFSAAGRTLSSHGFAGLTLERISDESKMSRGHIRHYVGNRDTLVLEFVDWLHDKYNGVTTSHLASAGDVQSALDYLFGPEFNAPDDNTAIFELLAASATNDELRARMSRGYGRTEAVLRSHLVREYPDAESARLDQVAHALLTLALGSALLSSLNPGTAGSADRAIAAALVDDLRRNPRVE